MAPAAAYGLPRPVGPAAKLSLSAPGAMRGGSQQSLDLVVDASLWSQSEAAALVASFRTTFSQRLEAACRPLGPEVVSESLMSSGLVSTDP